MLVPPFVQHALLFFLVVFPLWDYLSSSRLKKNPTPASKRESYRATILWQWSCVGILALIMPWRDLLTPPAGASLFPESFTDALAPGLLVGVMVGTFVLPLMARFNTLLQVRLLKPMQGLLYYLPRTGSERRLFLALVITVGICEEIIFRGFLLRYLTGGILDLSLFGALVVSSVIFGLCHSYQGLSGVVSTTAIGFCLGVIYVSSGSLILPIIIHVLFDLRVLFLRLPAETPVLPLAA